MANVCVGCGLDVLPDGRLVVSTVGAAGVHPPHALLGTPFPCTADTEFPPVYCDADGHLRGGAPEHTTELRLTTDQFNFVPDEALPHTSPITSMTLFNPSDCRTMSGWLQFASIASCIIGPGGAVNFVHNVDTGFGFSAVTAWQQHNEGTTTRPYIPMRPITLLNFSLPPGGSQLIRFSTTMTNVLPHAANRFASVAQEIRYFASTV